MTFSGSRRQLPAPAFGKWWLSQFRRWGMVKGTPDYDGVTRKVLRPTSTPKP